MELNGPEKRIDLHDASNELQTDQEGNMQDFPRAEDKLTDPTNNATEAEEPEKRSGFQDASNAAECKDIDNDDYNLVRYKDNRRSSASGFKPVQKRKGC
ncbi:hypothetical protein EW026_g8431 [Hermanssonia centrifuga]|uniref:Uncharacterized protein n=1 Tax=Hermanssonia centrifuga TaxID=98765 RepID=A0A4S4K439_9APHY|nr:hypothetical protein EW026_g8431 [Hermanssonia centrifuga]